MKNHLDQINELLSDFNRDTFLGFDGGGAQMWCTNDVGVLNQFARDAAFLGRLFGEDVECGAPAIAGFEGVE